MDDAAREERRVGAHLDLGRVRWVLAGTWVVFLLSLLLPHAGDIASWEVLAMQRGDAVRIPERVFVVLSTIAVGVVGGLLALTKRTTAAMVAFLVTGMALIAALLGLWSRIQLAETTGAPGVHAAMLVQAACVVVQLVCVCRVILRRTPEQLAAQERRAQAASQLDAVGAAQREASGEPLEENPLLVDDRRARARRRH